MDSLFLHYLGLWSPLAYAGVFLGMAAEGDPILFAIGFLTHRGFFKLPYIAVVVYSGVLFGDLCWYRLGTHLVGREGRIRRWVERIAAPFDKFIIAHPRRAIFISKFIYGLHRPTLIRAAMLGVPTKEFIRINIVAAAAWITVVGGIAYMASSSLSLIKHYFKFAEVALAVSLLIFILAEREVSRILKRRLAATKNGEVGSQQPLT